jgi:hypothetical protein
METAWDYKEVFRIVFLLCLMLAIGIGGGMIINLMIGGT